MKYGKAFGHYKSEIMETFQFFVQSTTFDNVNEKKNN